MAVIAHSVQPPMTLSAWLRHDLISAALASVPPGSRVLELGPGLGAMGARIAQDHQYVGVELDETAREVAHARVTPHGGVVTPSLEEVTGEFTAVCAFEVLEHIEDDKAALEAWIDRLDGGGRVVLSVPAWPKRFGPSDHWAGHYRRYTPDGLANLLWQVGLRNVGTHLYGFPITELTERVRNVVARRDATSGSLAERTAVSGQLLQPKPAAGHVTHLVSVPVRWLRGRLPGSTTRGTGLVAVAVKP